MKPTNPHLLALDVEPHHVLRHKLVNIHFFENFVVVEAEEGVTLSYQTAFSILMKAIQYCSAKPFFYISNRKNSYSVNPNDYKYLEQIPNLAGIAIVSPSELGKSNAELELNFFKKPMEIFGHIQDAYNWGNSLLTN